MTPLKDTPGALGRLLSAAAQPLPAEPNAKARVRARLFSKPAQRPLWVAGLASAAVGALAVLLALQAPRWFSAPSGPLTSQTVAGLELKAAPGATGSLSQRTLTLRSGVVDLVATQRATVETPRAHVEAENSRLRVAVSEVGDTAVLVYQGSAAVRASGSQQTQQVGSGQSWAEAANIDRAELLHREALRLEREGEPRRALQVLEGLFAHSGAWGELSLYDAARIHLALHERADALGLVEEHQRRFPQGTLSTEVAGLRERLGADEK